MWLQLLAFLNAQYGTPGCVPETRYPDVDRDGVGRAGPASLVCPTVPGFALTADDCDDRDAQVRPGAPETCNSVDDDCDGLLDALDPDADPWSCGHCENEADFDPAVLVERTRNPCVWDPSVSGCSTDPLAPDTHDQGDHLHRIRYRDDGTPLRPELLLFLPPGQGEHNEAITQWMAFAGYRVLSLGWQNDIRFEATCSDDVCFDDLHREHQDGTDASTLCDIPPADSVEGRLQTALTELAAEFPDEPWGSYLLPGGGIDTSRMVLVGWSGGATQSAYFSMDHAFAGLLLVSTAPEVSYPLTLPVIGAEWMANPRATPDCAQFGMYHRDEVGATPVDTMLPAMRALGMTGPLVDLDTSAPPYGGARLTNTANPGDYQIGGCNPHKSMAMDGCMDESFMRPVWFHWLCELPRGCATP